MLDNLSKIIDGGGVAGVQEALGLLPLLDQAALEKLVDDCISLVEARKCALLDLNAAERTYANTVAAYDAMNGIVSLVTAITGLAKQLSPHVAVRSEPYDRLQRATLQQCKDPLFFQAFCAYRDNQMPQEVLTSEQRYFFENALEEFLHSGYAASSEVFTELSGLDRAISDVCSSFEAAINNDTTVVAFGAEELVGMPATSLASQSRDGDGRVLLHCNWTTMTAVLSQCKNVEARRRFKKAYDRRAYPANASTLKELITLRARYAQLLGYENYAEYRLSRYMVGSARAAREFLDVLFVGARPAGIADLEKLCADLPEGVELVDGKLQSWDVPYVLAHYEKKHFALDKRAVAEYFPIEAAISAVFAVYEKFFSLSFDYDRGVAGAWHELVRSVTVYTKDRSRVLGYIFLDLFPRPQKYSHACCWSVAPRVWRHDSSGMARETAAVSVIVANFPLPHADAPSLLLHQEVVVFFHEFGHAIHNTLSCTQHLGLSGSGGVLMDFVELPSQILESWMWEPSILRLISSHYKTGEPLPEEVIKALLESRSLGQGFFVLHQIFNSRLSLDFYEVVDGDIDLDAFMESVYLSTLPHVAWDEENRFYAAFSHLTSYGPAYYGYLLTRAYAYDLFGEIVREGLLDESAGKRFRESVLRPGGAGKPLALLSDYLGREPSCRAYIDWLAEVSGVAK